MRNLVKILFIAILVIVAASWLTTAAFGHNNDGIQLNATMNEGPVITPAPVESAPAAAFYGGAIGGVTPGDLFYINTANVTADTAYTLYLTNADQLIPHLAYLNLNIAVYKETTPGQWEETQIPQQLLTMHNGHITFNLQGMANYKVTVEHGCFNCRAGAGDNGNFAPVFYLEAESM